MEKKIEQLKKGEVFNFPGKDTLFVAAGYNRHINKYEYTKYDDINAFKAKDKGTLVIVD